MGYKMMLMCIFLLTSAAFSIAGPATESVTYVADESSTLGKVLDWEHGTSSETEVALDKSKSENSTDLFYQTHGDKFYVSKLAKTWTDAAKSCESVGMRLASINSQKEQLELLKFLFINDLEPADDFSGYWLSGQQTEDGLYNWTALNKHINCWGWLPGEPSHIDDLEHCVELKFEAHKVRFGWNNLLCEMQRPFICQKEIVYNKDISLNQPDDKYQGIDEERQTSCYWFYNPVVPQTSRDRQLEGFIRLG